MRIATSWMLLVGRHALAMGIVGLGVVGLAAGDFIGRWEPVPTSFPLHHAFVWLSGVVLVACGAGHLRRQTVRAAALAFNVPDLVSSPMSRGAWTALLAEGALVGAAWAVAGIQTQDTQIVRRQGG